MARVTKIEIEIPTPNGPPIVALYDAASGLLGLPAKTPGEAIALCDVIEIALQRAAQLNAPTSEPEPVRVPPDASADEVAEALIENTRRHEDDAPAVDTSGAKSGRVSAGDKGNTPKRTEPAPVAGEIESDAKSKRGGLRVGSFEIGGERKRDEDKGEQRCASIEPTARQGGPGAPKAKPKPAPVRVVNEDDEDEDDDALDPLAVARQRKRAAKTNGTKPKPAAAPKPSNDAGAFDEYLDALRSAGNFGEMIAVLINDAGVKQSQLVSVCESLREDVPRLGVIKDLKSRIEHTLLVMGVDA